MRPDKATGSAQVPKASTWPDSDLKKNRFLRLYGSMSTASTGASIFVRKSPILERLERKPVFFAFFGVKAKETEKNDEKNKVR